MSIVLDTPVCELVKREAQDLQVGSGVFVAGNAQPRTGPAATVDVCIINYRKTYIVARGECIHDSNDNNFNLLVFLS